MEGVRGMDLEEDEKVEDIKPLMLVGKRLNGEEEEVALVEADLIKQSGLLMGTRWSDKTTPRLVVNILPQLLHLLVRFGKLVTHHNQLATQSLSSSSSSSSITSTTSGLIPLPVKSLPPQYNFQNRAMHLPYIIGFSPILAEFLNIVAERPYTGLQCAQAAEQLLWEPAQTAFLYKFGTFCKGLSHPFIELIWPSNNNNYSNDNNNNNNNNNNIASSSNSSNSSSSSGDGNGNGDKKVENDAMVICGEEIRWLETVVKLTGKFFEVPTVTNSNLLPPVPLSGLPVNKRSKQQFLKKRKTKSLPGLKTNTDGSTTYTPPPPPQLTTCKTNLSIHDAVDALQRWIDDSTDLH